MENKPLNIAIAGLGTVGIGVLQIFEKNNEFLKNKSGRPLQIKAVSARDRHKTRGVDLGKLEWVEDTLSLADREDIDIIVEVIGGSEGTPKMLVENALKSGKHVVTANKALLAHHGHALAIAAEEKQVSLRFEAAVAGGIPIIKSIMEGLSSNRILKVSGVMNGTCNYILTRMEATGASYNKIFSEAQKLGYVEADPTLDVGGIDAAQKLAILSSIAFQTEIDFKSIEIEGIERISLVDIENARAMGYRIKLIGISQLMEDGLYQDVQPCLVPKSSSISQLEGGTNMLIIDSDFIGQTSYSGPGAGGGPTASAIVSDIIDIAQGRNTPVFGVLAKSLSKREKGLKGIDRCYYLRFSLVDRPGALAQFTAILGENKISIDRMRQTAHDGEEAPVFIVTHSVTQENLNKALQQIQGLDVCIYPPVTIKIEEI